MTRLVAELGAVDLHEHLAAERDVGGMLTDVAARLEAMDPGRDLEQAERLGIRFVIPATRSGRAGSTTSHPPSQSRIAGDRRWVSGSRDPCGCAT